MTFKQDYFFNKFTHWKNDNRNLIISAVQSFDDIYSLILDKKRNSQNILCGLVI